MILVIITAFYAWNTHLQVKSMTEQADLIRNQNKKIDKHRMQQAHTHLQGIEIEFCDLYMLLVQTRGFHMAYDRLEYQDTLKNNEDKEIAKRELNRYQEEDSTLLIEVIRSCSRLLDALNMVQLLTKSTEIDNNIEMIYKNLSLSKKSLEKCTDQHKKELDCELRKKTIGISIKEFNEIRDKLQEKMTNEISTWLKKNVSMVIENISLEFKNEINKI